MAVQRRRYKGRFLSKRQGDRLNFFRDIFAAGRTVAKDRRGKKLPSSAGSPLGSSSGWSKKAAENVGEPPESSPVA